MKKFLLLFTFLFINISFGQKTITTYYFVRHAEKVDSSKNPDLSSKGIERADHWNKIFAEVDFDLVYTTDFKRTAQTASPTATAKKSTVKIYDPQNIAIESFKKETLGKKVLIVGHSNTIPDFVNHIINRKTYEDIGDSTFGNLYIVTLIGDDISHQLLKLE